MQIRSKGKCNNHVHGATPGAPRKCLAMRIALAAPPPSTRRPYRHIRRGERALPGGAWAGEASKGTKQVTERHRNCERHIGPVARRVATRRAPSTSAANHVTGLPVLPSICRPHTPHVVPCAFWALEDGRRGLWKVDAWRRLLGVTVSRSISGSRDSSLPQIYQKVTPQSMVELVQRAGWAILAKFG